MSNRRRTGPASAKPLDWLLLALLIALGGSSFAFIQSAIETAPPALVTIGRLWIAATFLYVAMIAKGRRPPPLLVRTEKGIRIHRLWAWMIAIGFVGYTIPFFIFPWAQQFVESGLAGVYMAFMPLWTLSLAYFFADEKLTPQKIAGFAMGFIGVLILMGPEVISGAAISDIWAQAALLLATWCYAASVVMARRAPPARPRVFATGIVLRAAVLSTPAVFLVEVDFASWSSQSLFSIVILGLGPTGLAGVIIIMLIRRAGAGFMALANYLTPIWAVIVGAIVFQERLEPPTFIALAVIFTGVAISQRKARPVVETGDAMAAELETVLEKDSEKV